MHSAAARNADPLCMAFRQRFEKPLLLWEMRHFTEYGIEKRRGHERTVEPDDLAAIEAGYGLIVTRLASLPPVFTHRDYHARNLLVRGDDLFVIDFQDALLGPAVYDLASLLRDSYIDLGGALIDDMVETYLTERERAGDGPFDRPAFRRDFDWQCVQRNLKAAGRFGFFDVVKGNPNFLADIPRTLGYVKKSPKYDELGPLRRALAIYVPELN
ncbi:MAG: phosphotransferase [Deltaproteobacteria bacterium]|nr:phosphotransferase [Deltaproteobacteria bacterium]